jgi:GTP-binding protein Era
MNKIDKLATPRLLKAIDEAKDLYPFADIVPVSGLTNDNVDRLIGVIKKYLTDDIKYFPEDEYTSSPLSFMASEIVREKILNSTEDEVPHSVTCYTIKYEDKKDIANIMVDIIVDRDSIKKIIIGHQGSKLKEVGTLARKEIEKLIGKQVYLELYVKTIEDWKDKEKYLIELGLKESE